jgi:hypothetical protein
LTGTSVRDTGLSAIVERDREGVLAHSEEEEEEEEGDEQSDEDVGKRPEAGEMRKGVEGERVVKSGYLLKKGERRKVGSWLGVGGLEVVVIASCADGGEVVFQWTELEKAVVRVEDREDGVLQG